MGKSKTPPPEAVHTPSPGRRAFICLAKIGGGADDLCRYRRFVRLGDPEPECPTHGRMGKQANKSYRGQPIP